MTQHWYDYRRLWRNTQTWLRPAVSSILLILTRYKHTLPIIHARYSLHGQSLQTERVHVLFFVQLFQVTEYSNMLCTIVPVSTGHASKQLGVSVFWDYIGKFNMSISGYSNSFLCACRLVVNLFDCLLQSMTLSRFIARKELRISHACHWISDSPNTKKRNKT